MDIASIVLESTNNASNVKELTNYKDETLKDSYFYETIQFCESLNEDYNSANKIFYKAVLESGDSDTLITEAFDGFIDKIKSILKKILEFIKRLWNRFITALNKFIGSKSFLKKHLDDLKNFTSEDEFDYDGFIFTIPENVPTNNVISDLYKNTVIDDTIIKAGYSKVSEKYEKLKNILDTDWYDMARAKILGDSGRVYESDYSDRLFEKFRDGADEKSSITVTSSIVDNCKTAFTKYESRKSETEKTKRRIENEYKDIADKYEKSLSLIDGIKYKYSYTIDNKAKSSNFVDDDSKGNSVKSILDQYAKLKASQVRKLSDIHLLAFSAKLDALKDEEKQSIYILYKALAKVKAKKND